MQTPHLFAVSYLITDTTYWLKSYLTGSALITIYPFTIEGLESARADGLTAAKDLYELPADTPIIEVDDIPKPFANRNYDAIYRVNMMNVLRLMASK